MDNLDGVIWRLGQADRAREARDGIQSPSVAPDRVGPNRGNLGMQAFSWRRLFSWQGDLTRSVRKWPSLGRPRLEALEDRLAPVTNLTIIPGAAGTGDLDAAFAANNGQLLFAQADTPNDTLS